jgi:hypothetical protein
LGVIGVEPVALRKELELRGLVLLGVSMHRGNPGVLMVFLHGNEGQWVGGYAEWLIGGVPGVLAVTESVRTPTILLVRVEPGASVGG